MMARIKTLAFSTACTLALGTGALAQDDAAAEDTPYDELAVFARAVQLLRQDYVDEDKVAFRDLIYSALRGMLQDLDPHSQFMPPEDFESMQEDTNSEFGGLGIIVSNRDGVLTVVSPMDDTPGARVGLLPNDQIVRIDGKSTDKLDVSAAIKLLRGAPGTKVTLTIARPSTREVKDYELTREVIKVPSVNDAKLLQGPYLDGRKIGYVRITQFNKPTAEEFGKALDKLDAEKIEALVLDLRSNPGGLLESARDVCAYFVPANEIVVFTKGRTPSQDRTYRTSRQGKPPRKYPIAVLVNGGSASGAEIVAGALKDLGRAVLVGETTFGKGSVQNVVPLPDGSAMRFTTAKYYTPGKQVIHGQGIEPTIRATFTPEQERLLQLSRREGDLTEKERADLAQFRDTQLDRAVDALKSVLVFRAHTPRN